MQGDHKKRGSYQVKEVTPNCAHVRVSRGRGEADTSRKASPRRGHRSRPGHEQGKQKAREATAKVQNRKEQERGRYGSGGAREAALPTSTRGFKVQRQPLGCLRNVQGPANEGRTMSIPSLQSETRGQNTDSKWESQNKEQAENRGKKMRPATLFFSKINQWLHASG